VNAARPPFVVVTGLAGAGKSTVAAPLARALGIPLVSKDAIKEALFDAVGIGDLSWSNTLSRAADAALVEIAKGLEAAVLDNFWRAETAELLLVPIGGRIVEVCCVVDPVVAESRWLARRRHPGHADPERLRQRPGSSSPHHKFPLGTLGPVVEVSTEGEVDIPSLAADVIARARTT
jgi:predicted kinase